MAELEGELEALYRAFVWAPGRVLWDDPASINDPGLRTMSKALGRRFGELETEVLVESAYFVPRESGTAAAELLRSKGIRIRVLTNSLASNDVLAAFAGYSKYRERLVAAGVELYELRPDAGPIRQRLFFGGRGGSRAGLFIESPVLAAQLADHMMEGVRLDNAYRVQLHSSGRLYWVTEDAGKEVRYNVDPLSTLLQRVEAGWIRTLPIEDQL